MRDGRNYSFDGRSNVRQITGQTFDGSNWRNYTITNAYDHKNRRVFKSYVQAGLSEAHWFFYYDQDGRLLEVKHTPNIASPSTYSVFQFYWIGRRAIAYWQQSFPSSTISRRYLHSDAENKVLEVWSWPTSGAATAQWRIEPDSFGWDIVLFGWSVYQPLRGAGGGEYVDEETISYNDSIGGLRPPLHTTLQGAYDPLVGQYLQSDDREGVDSYTGGTGVAARIKERCHWVRVGSPPWVGGENDIDLGVWTEVCWDRDQGDGGGGGGDTGGEGGTGGGLHGISPGTRRPPSRPPPQPDPRPTTPCDKAKADLKYFCRMRELYCEKDLVEWRIIDRLNSPRQMSCSDKDPNTPCMDGPPSPKPPFQPTRAPDATPWRTCQTYKNLCDLAIQEVDLTCPDLE